MRFSKLFIYSILLLAIAMTQKTAFSEIEGPIGVYPLDERFKILASEETATSETAQKMLGHLSLARESIFFGLKSSALDHLETARAEGTDLLKMKLEVERSLNLLFGKYSMETGNDRKVYIPILQLDAVEGVFNERMMGTLAKLKIDELSLIHTVVKLDMKVALLHMQEAQEFLSKDDYKAAMASLDKVFKSAIISEEKFVDPLLSVWANLILAREFMNEQTYKSARYSLKSAQNSLAQLEKKNVLKKDEKAARALHQEIAALSKELDEKAPGFWKRMRQKSAVWISKVRKWK